MSNLNFLLLLNTYSDQYASNAPSKSNFKWERSLSSFPVMNPTSEAFSIAPGSTVSLLNGVRTLIQDGTTEYSIAPILSSSTAYTLSWSGGTAPNFRTPRTPGTDATTEVNVTVNGPVATFTSTAGTMFSLISGGVVVGDNVIIGNNFNILNQGQYKIISLSATSFSIVNPTAAVEGPITLGSSFASQVQIFSAAGVQVGDTLKISGGFSLVTQGSYEVTQVAANSLQFSSINILPTEGPILTESITIYSDARQLIYVESDQPVILTINGIATDAIEPFVANSSTWPGVFLRKSTIYSLSITNSTTNTANIFFASCE